MTEFMGGQVEIPSVRRDCLRSAPAKRYARPSSGPSMKMLARKCSQCFRTHGLLAPNEARYQAAPRPDMIGSVRANRRQEGIPDLVGASTGSELTDFRPSGFR